MPAQKSSTFLRILVPVIMLALAAIVGIAVLRNTANTGSPAPGATTPAPATTTPPTTPPTTPGPAGATIQPQGAPPTLPAPPAAQPAPPAPGATQPAPTQPSAQPTATTPDPFTGLAPEVHPTDALALAPEPLGSLDPASDLEASIEFSPLGAGVRALRLTHHGDTIRAGSARTLVQEEMVYAPQGVAPTVMTPFAAMYLQVNGAVVPLLDARGPVFRQIAPGRPGEFEAFIVNGAGERVLRVERAWRLEPRSHVIRLEQRVTNLTQSPVRLRWAQYGPGDVPGLRESGGYGGEKRAVRLGRLLSPQSDPSRSFVSAISFVRQDAVGGRQPVLNPDGSPALDARGGKMRAVPVTRSLWPTRDGAANGHELVFAGMVNRYFGVAAHTPVDGDAAATGQPVDRVNRAVQTVNRVLVQRWKADGSQDDPMMALQLVGPEVQVAPAGVLDVSQGVYAGPLSRDDIRADADAREAGLAALVVFNFGGMCGPCTFAFLTSGLLILLNTLHDFVVFDWALAIILLVVIVRTILHPVTKWSQIRMQRFGKQMQAVAPKQKALQEKYKDDRRKLQGETAKLWREEGISPAGFLGCVPMFLQMPVWIALFAALFFFFDLRQQPAFFGVFQAIQPQSSPFWWFLGDLAEPDRFWYFARTPQNYIHIPLIGTLMGPIGSLNLLPFVLAVVYYQHTKFMQPASGVTMTPEQEMQQKMVKWMSVVLFPLFMYNAPSGLALYFIANSALAIVENAWVRRHIAKHDLLNLDKMKERRKTKPEGFFARLQKAAEERAKVAQQRRAQGAPGRGGATPPAETNPNPRGPQPRRGRQR